MEVASGWQGRGGEVGGKRVCGESSRPGVVESCIDLKLLEQMHLGRAFARGKEANMMEYTVS